MDIICILGLPLYLCIAFVCKLFNNQNYNIKSITIEEEEFNSMSTQNNNLSHSLPSSHHVVTNITYNNTEYFVKNVESSQWRELLTSDCKEEMREFIGVQFTNALLNMSENTKYQEQIVLPEIKFVVNSKKRVTKILSKSVRQPGTQITSLTTILSGLNSDSVVMPKGFETFNKEELIKLLPTLYKAYAIDTMIGNVDRHNDNIMLIRDTNGTFKLGLIDFGLTLHNPKRILFRIHRFVVKTFTKNWSFDNDKMIHEDALRISQAAGITETQFLENYKKTLQETKQQYSDKQEDIINNLRKIIPTQLCDKVKQIINHNKEDLAL